MDTSGSKIVVVGCSGSGKTTLARAIGAKLGIKHVEIDALHWGPDWQGAAPDVLRERMQAALAAPAWVVDGNYRVCRDITWSQANAIVWLDYPFPLVFARVLRRTLARTFRREVLWGGNRESLRRSFFSRDSILLWVIQTHAKRRREYPELLRKAQHARLTVIRCRRPADAAAFLAALGSGAEQRHERDEHAVAAQLP